MESTIQRHVSLAPGQVTVPPKTFPSINFAGSDWQTLKNELNILIERETKDLVTKDLTLEQVSRVRGGIQMLHYLVQWEEKYKTWQQNMQKLQGTIGTIPPSY